MPPTSPGAIIWSNLHVGAVPCSYLVRLAQVPRSYLVRLAQVPRPYLVPATRYTCPTWSLRPSTPALPSTCCQVPRPYLVPATKYTSPTRHLLPSTPALPGTCYQVHLPYLVPATKYLGLSQPKQPKHHTPTGRAAARHQNPNLPDRVGTYPQPPLDRISGTGLVQQTLNKH